MPVVLSKTPAGTSTKTVVHYAQEIYQKGNFQQFDYGSAGNIIQYGSKYPPKYKVKDIKTSIYMMYAMNDFLANYTVSEIQMFYSKWYQFKVLSRVNFFIIRILNIP